MSSDPPLNLSPGGEVTRAAEHWGQMARVSAEERRDVSWLDSKLVQRLYLHPTIGGDPERNWLEYFKRRHLPQTVSRGLTIGCGDGGLERHGSALGLCDHYDAFASMALHHIENLEHVFDETRAALNPGSLFVFNEYVGPDRFQWTRRRLLAINAILVLLPARLRRGISDGRIKPRVQRPTVEAMIQIDPSEAVRSSAILPLAERYFRTVERIDYGGTILHMLLHDIIGNFRAENRRDVAMLSAIFAYERWLLHRKILSSDFTVVVARRD